MKILKLKFKNLNSLKGEWNIDFTSDEFNSGIFAITGPTGSGKTTILDALCLGIYGRSPRETARKSENEIMSKGTGDCFSEVEFECNDLIVFNSNSLFIKAPKFFLNYIDTNFFSKESCEKVLINFTRINYFYCDEKFDISKFPDLLFITPLLIELYIFVLYPPPTIPPHVACIDSL